LTGGQRRTNNLTSGLYELTARHSCQRIKKNKTPHRTKNILNFYGNHTSGTFAFAATSEAIPKAKAKEPLFANALSISNENKEVNT